MKRCCSALVALALSVGLSACAWLPGSGSTEAARRDAEPTGPPVVRVEVVAPAPLKLLLERYLDLSRLASMTRGEAVTDNELTRLVAGAPVQVRELLQTEGYFSPSVSVKRLGTPAPGQPETVHIDVEPGPRASVSRVTLEVEGPLERSATAGDRQAAALIADLQAAWQLPPGRRFDNTGWSAAKAAAMTRLRAAGYATANWTGTSAEVDAGIDTVRLFLVADSGPLFRSGPLQIEGLVEQDAATVNNLANFPPGTPVTEALVLDFQERLQKAGLFESVTVTLDPKLETADAAPLIVRLREQTIQVYTFGVGISANTGPRASVEHVYRRVFGWPATASNKFEWGQLRQYWSGELSSHTSPGLHRYLLGGTVERLESDTDIVLSQRARIGRATDLQRLERLAFVEAERGERQTAAERTTTFALSANYHVIVRQLDSLVLPTDGYSLSAQTGFGRSHGNASNSGLFARLYGRLTVYRPLGGGWFGQARLELGQVFLPAGVAAPDSQLWRAGGDDSVRGYAYRSLAPTVDGSVTSAPVLMTSSAEVGHPILASFPSLWGALFIDAGRAGNRFDALHPAIGYGAGLRWRSPVGPLRVDLAWAQELQKLRLHFSVGIAF